MSNQAGYNSGAKDAQSGKGASNNHQTYQERESYNAAYEKNKGNK